MKGMQESVNKAGQMFGGSGKQDVIGILKADHRKVEKLFTEFEEARGARKKTVVNQIIKELTVHSAVEEEMVYPLLLESKEEDTADGSREAYEEHHLLKVELAEIAKPLDAKTLKAKITVLKELVQHHVKEEEKELLPALKKSGIDIERLGSQVLKRKQELMADRPRRAKSSTVKKARKRTSSKSSKSRRAA
jgi:hypothetical protein